MIIEMDSVGTEPRVIDAEFDPVEIDLEGESVLLTGPVKLTGWAERRATRVHLHGTMITDLGLECTRCLEPTAMHLEVPFEDVFVDSSEEPKTHEVHVAEAELDVALIEGDEIDLRDVVREQVLLAVPIQVFCKEDCRGLCPKCGENRNLIDCKCSDDDIDPRWAALKSLK